MKSRWFTLTSLVAVCVACFGGSFTCHGETHDNADPPRPRIVP